MEKDFFRTPRGIMALAAFLVGTSLYSGPSIRDSLVEIPWKHLPAALGQHSFAFYDATFMQVAGAYMVGLEHVSVAQDNLYATLGEGLADGAEVLAQTPPVAAVAEWYVDAHKRINSRLTP